LTLSAAVQDTTNPLLLGAVGSAVPSGNLQFGGSGGSRAMIILPNASQTGRATVRVTVTDQDSTVIGSGPNHTAFADFVLIVQGAPPTITSVANQTTQVNQATTPTTFTVGDSHDFPGFLTVGGKSSDQTIVPDGNIFILGNTATRTVSVLAGNKGGNATITLTVTNTSLQTASTTFVVTVQDNRQPPTISSVGAQSTTKNKATSAIQFIVGDKETAVGSLAVTGTSANTTLVPNGNIVVTTVAGNPAARNVVITPATDQVGVALITMKVTDSDNMTATTTFALSVTSQTIANDLNGDGSADIVFEDARGYLAAWFMSGDDMLSNSLFTPNNVGDVGWKVVGMGDFNGDGRADLLFQHTDGSLAVWALGGANGVTMTGTSFLNPANSRADWKAIAVADFDGDGKPDILFQNDDSSLAVWLMDGVNLKSVATTVPARSGTAWKAVGVGDFNNDKVLDILFQADDGTLAVWQMMKNYNLNLATLLTPSNPGDVNWRAMGTIDLNGDSKPDILFQNRSTGDVSVWYMNGFSLQLGKTLNPSHPGGTWQLRAP